MVLVYFIGLCIFLFFFSYSRANEQCFSDKCPKYPPSARCGNLMMTIYYDNDKADAPDQKNANLIQIACTALGSFGEEFNAEFLIGAQTTKDEKGALHCLAGDCKADLLDACASLKVKNFSEYVCCKSANKDVYECAKKFGVSDKVLNECVEKKEGEAVLLKNNKEREDLKIPVCFLPQFLINWKLDPCIKITTYDEFKNAFCKIYLASNIFLRGCGNYD